MQPSHQTQQTIYEYRTYGGQETSTHKERMSCGRETTRHIHVHNYKYVCVRTVADPTVNVSTHKMPERTTHSLVETSCHMIVAENGARC